MPQHDATFVYGADDVRELGCRMLIDAEAANDPVSVVTHGARWDQSLMGRQRESQRAFATLLAGGRFNNFRIITLDREARCEGATRLGRLKNGGGKVKIGRFLGPVRMIMTPSELLLAIPPVSLAGDHDDSLVQYGVYLSLGDDSETLSGMLGPLFNARFDSGGPCDAGATAVKPHIGPDDAVGLAWYFSTTLEVIRVWLSRGVGGAGPGM